MMSEKDEMIQLLVDLVRSNATNPPGTEAHTAHIVAQYLKRHDVPVQWQEVAPGRANLVASLGDTECVRRPILLFCGHLDTVPVGSRRWTHEPFGAEVIDGVLFGRGAADMKSGVAAMAVMMGLLRKEARQQSQPITLVLTVGEEVDSVGAQRFHDKYDMASIGGMVIGEPTQGQIAVGHKGAYWLEIRCFGRTAHGSMPALGQNAIDGIVEAAAILRNLGENFASMRDPLLGEPTVAVTQIGGGVQTNVIPDQAFLRADMRFVTVQQQQQVLKAWQTALNRHSERWPQFRYEWNPVLERLPLLTVPSHPLIQQAQALRRVGPDSWRTVSYYTDGSVLAAPTQIPTLIFGPGDDRLAHQSEESVSLVSYVDSIEFYRELATSYARGEWELSLDSQGREKA